MTSERNEHSHDVIPDPGPDKSPRSFDVIPDPGFKPDNNGTSDTTDTTDSPKPGRGGSHDWDPPLELCFSPDTRVEMADGSLRAIREIHPGDRVRSWDLRSAAMAQGNVDRVITGTTDLLIRLNGRLSASSAHRILSTRGYLRFDEVELGDLIFRSSGSPEAVTTIEVLSGDHRVHNLIVSPHGSFVAEGLLVEDQDGVESLRLVEAVTEEDLVASPA